MSSSGRKAAWAPQEEMPGAVQYCSDSHPGNTRVANQPIEHPISVEVPKYVVFFQGGRFFFSQTLFIFIISDMQKKFSSVLSHIWLFATYMDGSTPGFPVHHQLPELAPTQVHHPTISSSVIPFSSCLQFFPASRSFPMSQFFASGGQSIEASASAAVLPMNIQDWFPLGWTYWISLQSKGLSRDFSNTTVQKHQFFGAQLSLWSSSLIHTWLVKKP